MDDRPPFTTRVKDRGKAFVHALTTRDGLLGDYDYAYLFIPNLPFMKRERAMAPFIGLDDKIPVVLAILLGLQHALSMLAGIIAVPIIITTNANLPPSDQQYLVSTFTIVSGILSAVQITRFHIYKTPYYIGTGLLSVVGTSFAVITVASGGFQQMYNSGFCKTAADGTQLPCPQGYGALLGTSAVCSLLEMLLSFTPPPALKRIFPPSVTGPVVTLIGVSLIETGLKQWGGGAGPCFDRPNMATAPGFQYCPYNGAPHELKWGSAEFIGLGFLVFVTIILCERFGSPIMKTSAVVIGLLVGCIVAAACGYFDPSGIDDAPVISFIWVKTFPLSIHPPLVLPFLAVYIVLATEAIGDITATCDVSALPVRGRAFDSRIQGGILSDGISGLVSALCTTTPMSVFAQNNGVVALTRCANRTAGLACCCWLILMGLLSKFAAALVAIPSSVLGGMTTFLFTAVAVSGLRIISTVRLTRRNRFVLTCALSIGFGAILVPNWFSYVFTYSGNNQALTGFLDAIVLVMETGFAVTGILAVLLNLILPDEADEMDLVMSGQTLGNDEDELSMEEGIGKLEKEKKKEQEISVAEE